MRWLLAILLLLLLLLQGKLWFGDHSLPAAWRLSEQVEEQQAENAALRERNARLEAEVDDLKEGLSAVEERARSELGMIREGETFYQVVESGEDGQTPSEPRDEATPGDDKAGDEDAGSGGPP